MYAQLGLEVLADEAFRAMVLARIVEPTSKADSLRAHAHLGAPAPPLRTLFRSLKRHEAAVVAQDAPHHHVAWLTGVADLPARPGVVRSAAPGGAAAPTSTAAEGSPQLRSGLSQSRAPETQDLCLNDHGHADAPRAQGHLSAGDLHALCAPWHAAAMAPCSRRERRHARQVAL